MNNDIYKIEIKFHQILENFGDDDAFNYALSMLKEHSHNLNIVLKIVNLSEEHLDIYGEENFKKIIYFPLVFPLLDSYDFEGAKMNDRDILTMMIRSTDYTMKHYERLGENAHNLLLNTWTPLLFPHEYGTPLHVVDQFMQHYHHQLYQPNSILAEHLSLIMVDYIQEQNTNGILEYAPWSFIKNRDFTNMPPLQRILLEQACDDTFIQRVHTLYEHNNKKELWDLIYPLMSINMENDISTFELF